MIYKVILNENKALFFIIIVLIVAGCSFYINKFIISDSLFYTQYSERLSIEQIESILKVNRRLAWSSYIFIPLVVFVKIAYNSSCFYIGSFFSEKQTSFKSFFNIALKAELTFCLLLFVKIIFFEFLLHVESLNDLNFMPLSLQQLLMNFKYPRWFTYPLQTANLFEILYILLVAKLISIDGQKSFRSSLRFVISSYLPAILFWMLIVVYLSILIS